MDKEFLKAAKQMRRAYVQLVRSEFSIKAKDIKEVASFNKELARLIKEGKAT